jgi:hypothetical protein
VENERIKIEYSKLHGDHEGAIYFYQEGDAPNVTKRTLS